MSSPFSVASKVVRASWFDGYCCTLLLPRELVHLGMGYRSLLATAQQSSIVSPTSGTSSPIPSADTPPLALLKITALHEEVSQWASKGCPSSHAHPLFAATAHPVFDDPLTRAKLLRAVGHWRREVAEPGVPDTAALYRRSDATHLALFRTLLTAAGCTDEADHRAASHLARAYTLATVLRSVPALARATGTVDLPRDALLRNDVSAHRDVVRVATGEPQHTDADAQARLATAARELAQEAVDWLRAAGKEEPSPVARRILLPGVMAATWLDKLRAAHFNVFDPAIGATPRMLPATLWWSAHRGKIGADI